MSSFKSSAYFISFLLLAAGVGTVFSSFRGSTSAELLKGRPAAGGFVFHLEPSSSVVVRGTSNVTGYTCSSSQVLSAGALSAVVHAESGLVSFSGPGMQVPVNSIDCGNAIMNRDLRNTLKVKTHPTVNFYLNHVKFQPGMGRSDGMCSIWVEVAGRKKMMEVPFRYELTDRALVLKGSAPLGFALFGLEPPQRAGGLIAVADKFNVDFNLVFAPQRP